MDLGGAIISIASLSFLGLGAQQPKPEWGAMLSSGREYMRYAPWTMIYPGLFLFLKLVKNLIAKLCANSGGIKFKIGKIFLYNFSNNFLLTIKQISFTYIYNIYLFFL